MHVNFINSCLLFRTNINKIEISKQQTVHFILQLRELGLLVTHLLLYRVVFVSGRCQSQSLLVGRCLRVFFLLIQLLLQLLLAERLPPFGLLAVLLAGQRGMRRARAGHVLVSAGSL